MKNDKESYDESDILTPKTSEDKARDFYTACINLGRIEKLGWSPLRVLIQNITNTFTEESFSSTLGDLRRKYAANIFVSFKVDVDERNTSRYIIYVEPTSLGLDRDDLLTGVESAAFRNYREIARDSWTQAAASSLSCYDVDAIVNSTLEFEITLAKLTYPISQNVISHAYQFMTLKKLQDMLQNSSESSEEPSEYGIKMNWTEYMVAVFAETDISIDEYEPILVRKPKYFSDMLKLLHDTSWDTLVNYLTFRMMLHLGSEVVRSDPPLTSTTEKSNRWFTCISNLNAFMGLALTKMYINKNQGNNYHAEQISKMVLSLKDSFNVSLQHLQWMDISTRRKAEEKLAAMTVNVMYPAIVEDQSDLNQFYEKLAMDDSDHLSNVLNLLQWSVAKTLSLLRKEVGNDGWQRSPMTVNAYYYPHLNSITVPIAIMQPPFFDPGFGSLNFGALGMIIGHEIIHGFDDQGRNYDSNGNLVDWWSYGTINKYRKRAQCFVQEYNNFEAPFQNGTMVHLNGNLTLHENIADDGGIRIAFRSFQSDIKNNGLTEYDLPGFQNYTEEQLFFISFANNWCSFSTPSSLYIQALRGHYSPSRFRVLGPLRNFKAFYEAWNCTAQPGDTCSLW